VHFITSAVVKHVGTLRPGSMPSGGMPTPTVGSDATWPLMRLTGTGAGGGGGGVAFDIECEALLVATGRAPNVSDLGLEAAGIEYSSREGIKVDDLGVTTNPAVYAIGDCAAGVPRQTHMAGEMAKLAVQNALFADEWKISSMLVPRCTFTDPEVASVGLTAAEASATGVAIDSYESSLTHNDRAILEDQGGLVQVHCIQGTEKVVGATVVSAHAGDIISEATVAIQAGVGLSTLARVIHPYPTTAEGIMQCGLGYIRKHWERIPAKN